MVYPAWLELDRDSLVYPRSIFIDYLTSEDIKYSLIFVKIISCQFYSKHIMVGWRYGHLDGFRIYAPPCALSIGDNVPLEGVHDHAR